jgi:hypothetical protein
VRICDSATLQLSLLDCAAQRRENQLRCPSVVDPQQRRHYVSVASDDLPSQLNLGDPRSCLSIIGVGRRPVEFEAFIPSVIYMYSKLTKFNIGTCVSSTFLTLDALLKA